MKWNFDISEAPKGRTEVQKKALRGVEREYKIFVPDHIIAASSCGVVTRSYWVPKEERWCMFTKDAPPVAWMPWPEHPGEAA